jgi:bifunctional DNase/RNase
MARTWIWPAAVALLLLAPMAQAGVALKGKTGDVRMTVREVKYDRGSYVVLLQTVAGDRLLPIWIGDREAQAIQLRLSNGKTPRPMTHDLMESILTRLKIKIARVEVDDLRNNVFHGKLTLKNNGRQHRIDGRPSDLITLAVGANLPIYVAPHVLKKAGISTKPKSTSGGSANPQEI